jgi:hypothetical protein
MPDYVTIAAKIEATGAALTARELQVRLIHHPNPHPNEVTPTPTTP